MNFIRLCPWLLKCAFSVFVTSLIELNVYALPPSLALIDANQSHASCRVFQNGVDAADVVHKIENYRSVRKVCFDLSSGESKFVTRTMKLDGHDVSLAVAAESLKTELIGDSCLKCSTEVSVWPRSQFTQALETTTSISVSERQAAFLRNQGLVRALGEPTLGSFLTADLCPSHHSLERGFLEGLIQKTASGHAGLPLAVSVSGTWLKHHASDFAWLKAKAASGEMAITWVNHSLTHPFAHTQFSHDFLLTPGLDHLREIFGNESLLIAHGVTPSVYFRFPGLISNAEWVLQLRDASLVPLGADAWLALGQRARNGSVVLIHPNGNEPYGLVLMKHLLDRGALPLPMRGLEDGSIANSISAVRTF